MLVVVGIASIVIVFVVVVVVVVIVVVVIVTFELLRCARKARVEVSRRHMVWISLTGTDLLLCLS